jgi:hypothetical protein
MKLGRTFWHGPLVGVLASGIATTLALVLFFVTAQARAQSQCPVIGSAATWGFPSTGYFDVSPGGTCLFSLNINGEIRSSNITQATREWERKHGECIHLHLQGEPGLHRHRHARDTGDWNVPRR